MNLLSLDYTHSLPFIKESELNAIAHQVNASSQLLHQKTGPGNQFLGWLTLPENYDKKEFNAIRDAAIKIKDQSEILVVIGIGGSYLGAKAAVEFLTHSFYNQLPHNLRDTPEIYFAGTNLSSTYLNHLLEIIGERDFSINVISKSGTTTEPALAFRVLRKKLELKYGKAGAADRIYATTDNSKGALKKLATQEGYQTFTVPDDIGGRFSVMTAVGLLPMAAVGIDINSMMEGAHLAMTNFIHPFSENICYQYAAIRNILYRKGKMIEMLINYEPKLHYVAEWWKQLFGESEGKDAKGLFPASADYTTDLHSLGQYVQDGRRHIIETLLQVHDRESDIEVEKDAQNLDGLNYLADKSFDYINKKAAEGTLMAHVEGGIPNLILTLPEASAFHLGYLFYFFEKACAMSGYLLGVNPFDQPGVEAYKKKMFTLLGKPGI
jgi:glucose-6-phosphate isomerase